MRRREFLRSLAGFVPFVRPALAQKSASKKRVALVAPTGSTDDMRIGGDARYDAFIGELNRLGYVEGENLTVERYSAEGARERADAIVREIVGSKPDAIWSVGTPLTRLFKAATTTIPIIAFTGDPVRFGLISSLAHPGGNITGVSVDAGIEIWGKRLELLAQAVPKLINVAFVSTQAGWDGAGGRIAREAAQKLGTSLVNLPLAAPFDEAEFRRVFGSIQTGQFDGVTISDEGETYTRRLLVVQLIQQIRLPAIYAYRDQTEAGGLMSYSYDNKGAARRNAVQIVEVLRGASPADMPYVQETRFELVINLKTAKALGLDIPAGLIARADEVIE
jgi:putative ABC transport system substrate-binding protein